MNEPAGEVDNKEDESENIDEELEMDESDENSKVNGLQISSLETKQSKMAEQRRLSKHKHRKITEDNYDFSLIDELFAFLDREPAPILCGYFNQMVQRLLGTVKVKLLTYVLVKRRGDIFDKLMQHL